MFHGHEALVEHKPQELGSPSLLSTPSSPSYVTVDIDKYNLHVIYCPALSTGGNFRLGKIVSVKVNMDSLLGASSVMFTDSR